MIGVNDTTTGSQQLPEKSTTKSEVPTDSPLNEINDSTTKTTTRTSITSDMQSVSQNQLLIEIKRDKEREEQVDNELQKLLDGEPKLIGKSLSVSECPYQQAAKQFQTIEIQLQNQLKGNSEIAREILSYSTFNINGVDTQIIKVSSKQFQLLELAQSAIMHTKKEFPDGPGNQWWANEDSKYLAGHRLDCRKMMMERLFGSSYSYTFSQKVQMSLCAKGGLCQNLAEVAAYNIFFKILPHVEGKENYRVFLMMIGAPIKHNLIAVVHKDDVEKIKQLESETYTLEEFGPAKYRVKHHPVLFEIIAVDPWIKNAQALLLVHYFPQPIDSLYGTVKTDCNGIDTNSGWFTPLKAEEFKSVMDLETTGGVFGSLTNYKEWSSWVESYVSYNEGKQGNLPGKHDGEMFNVQQPSGKNILYINENYEPLIPLDYE